MTNGPQTHGPCLRHSGFVIPSDFVICHSSFSGPIFIRNGFCATARAPRFNMMPARQIRAVTFDVGGTLIRPWPSVGHVYAEVAARHGCANVAAETLNTHFATAWRAKKNFDHSRRAWLDLVEKTFAGLVDQGVVKEFFNDLYD